MVLSDRKLMLRQFALFTLVGGIGFIVDASVLVFLTEMFDANLYLARGISWLIAATVTWRLNRRLSFRSRGRQGAWQQWLRFLAANLGGGLINLTVSTLLIAAADVAPIPAVACGSLSGLLWNFVTSRRFVFADRSTDGIDAAVAAESRPNAAVGRRECR